MTEPFFWHVSQALASLQPFDSELVLRQDVKSCWPDQFTSYELEGGGAVLHVLLVHIVDLFGICR